MGQFAVSRTGTRRPTGLRLALRLAIAAAAFPFPASALERLHSCSAFASDEKLQAIDRSILHYESRLLAAQELIRTMFDKCYSSATEKEEKRSAVLAAREATDNLLTLEFQLKKKLGEGEDHIRAAERSRPEFRDRCSEELSRVWRYATYRAPDEPPCLDLLCKSLLVARQMRFQGAVDCWLRFK